MIFWKPIELKRDYTIWEHPNGYDKLIQCLKCHFQSHNKNDISTKYCPICKIFHSEETE